MTERIIPAISTAKGIVTPVNIGTIMEPKNRSPIFERVSAINFN